MKRKLSTNKRMVRRWTADEISKIIDYMTEFGNIEKPTARAYYENMLRIYPIDASWDLIKWKVRYLKTMYSKAVQWIDSDEAKQLDSYKFEERLLRFCPNYYRLYKIFGQKRAEIVEIMDSNSSDNDCYGDVEDTVDYTEDVKYFTNYNITASNYLNGGEDTQSSIKLNVTNGTMNNEDKQADVVTERPALIQPEVVMNEEDTISTPDAESEQPAAEECYDEVATTQQVVETENADNGHDDDENDDAAVVKRLKKESLRRSLSALSKSQEGRNETQLLRLKFEEYKFAQEFEFVKDKFKAEMELKKEELELKRREIESNEKLRIMEMEKNERIAKYEISMKYNNGQSKYANNLHVD